jgi:prepilin-type N-terminal cleavage/methylation domain-containing protein
MTSRRERTGQRLGFTLIEVLVVVAIISLLIAMLIPSLVTARGTARMAKCLSNLRQIGQGMVGYTQSNQGWLPAGPADQLNWMNVEVPSNQPQMYSDTPVEGSGWRAMLWYPWQWGGHRAGYMYLQDENKNSLPETLVRPLTPYVQPRATLDSKTPVFECPGDDGLEYWDRVTETVPWRDLGRRPVHELVGNSYQVQTRGTLDRAFFIKQFKRRPGQVGLVREAVMYYDGAYYSPPNPRSKTRPIRQLGWHARQRGYTMLFLDTHAEFKFFPSLYANAESGGDWAFISYPYIMDYYR